MQPQILLLESDPTWAEQLIYPLQKRGWEIQWFQNARQLEHLLNYSGAFLINLNDLNETPNSFCHRVRSTPKGRNASIFLLNDGQHSLRSFEDAMSVQADGLYFKSSHFQLILANFPTQVIETPNIHPSNDAIHSTQVGHHLSHTFQDSPPSLSRSSGTLGGNRVDQLSLAQMHKKGQTIGYQTNTDLLRSEIEKALQAEENKEKSESLNLSSNPSLSPSVQMHTHISRSSTSHSIPTPKIPPTSALPALPSSVIVPSPSLLSQPQSLLVSNHTSTQHPSLPYPPLAPPSSYPRSLSRTSNHQLPWGDELSLDSIDFAQVFLYSIAHQKTLNLEVLSSHGYWVIHIEEGQVIAVNSSRFDESLLGYLSTYDYLTFSELQTLNHQDSHLDIIDLLLEEEWISISDLQTLIHEVTHRLFLHLFSLTQGKIKTSPYHRPKEAKRLNQSLLRLSLKGIRDSYDRLRLYSRFGNLKLTPILKKKNSLFKTELEEHEWQLLSLANGSNTISHIVNQTQLDSLHVLSFYYTFYLLGEIHIQTATPLSQYYQRTIKQDYFQLLSLPYDASKELIQEAWQSHRQWIAQQQPQNQRYLKSIIQVLDDAYRILAYDPLKERYLKALKQPIYTPESIMPQQIESTPIHS